MAARFIGVQLEVESPRPLGHLFHSFSGAEVVSVDYRESARGFAAAFEHAGRGVSTGPDIQIADFCDKITAFKDDGQSVWNGAYRRTFNVGYEIDDSSECFRSELAPETMQRIARVGASVIVAIYPQAPGEPGSEG
ncbi:MAG: hypothetical protein OXQ31_15800 [Spirochaetaceae bacterium]|nr:hypothetical protein [Spirochaetaceae bacterium]